MKILIVDIETSPHLSYHFGRWQCNIPPEHTIEESRVICWAAKWLGDENKVQFMSEWGDGFKPMIKGIYNLLNKADVVVGFNSDKFDVKTLNSEFLRLGFGPTAPYQKVDLYKQIKKHFAYSSNRLKHLLKDLNLTPKVEDIDKGLKLWIDAVHYNKRTAQKRMQAYNIQDVKSTEELYNYILGWITPHPNWGLFVEDAGDGIPTCPNCGDHTRLIKHKVRTTKLRKYQQYHCRSCGAYSRGRKNLGVNGVDNGLLA